MKCSITPSTTYSLTVDHEAIGVIEKALSYYRDRAILPDTSSVAELSRMFTAFLLQMRTGAIAAQNAIASVGGDTPPPILPEPEEVTEDVESEPVNGTEGAEEPEDGGLNPEVEPLDSPADEWYCPRCGRNPVDVLQGEEICKECRGE